MDKDRESPQGRDPIVIREAPAFAPPPDDRSRFSFERFTPMVRLLDDAEILGVNPDPELFARARAKRRRIFRMYVAEFGRQSRDVVSRRLAAIGSNGEWDELPAALRRAGALAGIWLRFYRAWLLHGLRVRDLPPKLVTDSLRAWELLLRETPTVP